MEPRTVTFETGEGEIVKVWTAPTGDLFMEDETMPSPGDVVVSTTESFGRIDLSFEFFYRTATDLERKLLDVAHEYVLVPQSVS